jgi:hypothetical protein
MLLVLKTRAPTRGANTPSRRWSRPPLHLQQIPIVSERNASVYPPLGAVALLKHFAEFQFNEPARARI